MRKLFLALFLIVASVSVNAQFDKGTKYANLSLTGFDMSYSKNTKFHFGLEAMGGYFVAKDWMVDGRFGYNHQGGADMNTLELGAGCRYYFQKTGVFVGGGLLYEFNGVAGFKNNYIHFTPEAGYCFYVNHYVSIEPAVYCNVCMNEFSDASRIGLKLGVGFYF